MEHWPGHQRREITKTADKSKDKGKPKEHPTESAYWQWPHLEHGSIGRGTLISKNGRVQWSCVSDTSPDMGSRWLPLGKPAKIFPETRSPQVNVQGHSASQRAEKGLQYLRTYFPDADLPGELLRSAVETECKEMQRLETFDPFLGNMLEIMPSNHARNEYTVVFPMGELRRELNISRFTPDMSGNMVFHPAGLPSVAFETPILQISSATQPPEWTSMPFSSLLIRTHTSSSLLRLDRSKVTRELDITRSETGGVPIVDSRILGSGPDIVVVNLSGKIYKCNTYNGGKAMQLIGGYEASNDDFFWQLGITSRHDECFLASRKSVRHIDLRSSGAISDAFFLVHSDAIVTSFESPTYDHMSCITTTSDLIWLDDRFRKRPLLSFKHYRNFDRSLRVLAANFSGVSCSLLASRRNGLVTLYDVGKGPDGLLHCNSVPSCLPHDGPTFTTYDGHALVVLPSNAELAFVRLSQRGSIHRQDVRIVKSNEDQIQSVPQSRVTHQWEEDIEVLEKRVNELQIDYGPAGRRHYAEVDLRGAYKKIFAFADDTQKGRAVFKDILEQLPDVLQETEENTMLTTFDVISRTEDANKRTSRFLAGTDANSKQIFDTLTGGHVPVQKLAGLARWHYNIHDTSVPGLQHHSANCSTLHEYLERLNLVSGAEGENLSVRREVDAREQLVVDLALSNDVYSVKPFGKFRSLAADQAIKHAVAHSTNAINGEEPPEVEFGYLRPVRKSGADHYSERGQDDKENQDISNLLGVRLLLAEWEHGTDPNDYTYRDPYDFAESDTQPIPQYRRPLSVEPTRQKKQVQLQQPPLVVAAVTQPPLVQSQIQQTHSQPSLGIDAPSQEPMMSTQVVPGRFGGRPNAGKKAGKKRIGGF